MFPLFKQRAALKMLQALYCESDHERCARFKSMEAGVIPAANLLPSGESLPDEDQSLPDE